MSDRRLNLVGFSTKSFRQSSGKLLNEKDEIQRQPSFYMHLHVQALIDEYQRNPSIDLEEKIGEAIEGDFPTVHHFPTPIEMDASVTQQPTNPEVKFEKGQWCEYLDVDMKWHLAQVRRVVRVAAEDYDPTHLGEPKWEFWYQFDGNTAVSQNDVRASEEGLKRIFGFRPWVWQQWAMLQTEDYIRFQQLHDRDFEMVNFEVSASVLFKNWLYHEKNKDFCNLYLSRPKKEQQKLLHHLCTPFAQMNLFAFKGSAGGWDFNDTNISSYSYQSVLGAGWISAILVMGIQLVIPAMLLYSAMKRSPRLEIGGQIVFTEFCNQQGEIDGMIVNFCVIIFYAIRQVPQVMYYFYETAGDVDSTRSKLNSLRYIVWEQGCDTFGMQVGYKLEKYMNSTYIAVVNAIMLFVLFLQDDPTEIILNAIAIEFVLAFAIEVAKSSWMDPTTRYIRAGAIELVFRNVIDKQALADGRAFCKKYDIDYDAFKSAVAKDGFAASKGLKCRRLALLDDETLEYAQPKDRVWRVAEAYARKTGNQLATWVFAERPKRFGLIFRWLDLFGLGGSSIFMRYTDYHTWSRWEQALFMSPCTKVMKKGDTWEIMDEEYRPESLASVQEELTGRTLYAEYLNEHRESELRNWEKFALQIFRTLTFQTYIRNLRVAIRQRSIPSLIFKAFDGLFEWVAYLYQILFPLTLVGFVILLFTCY